MSRGPSRPPAGLYLESTPDERYGVLPGEDRLVRDVMRPTVRTIDPRASLQEAARMIRDHAVPALIVCRDGEIVGTVSEHDIAVNGATQARSPDTVPVHEVMAPAGALVCRDDAILADAARLMAEQGLRCLPVMDERGAVVGLLTMLDVAVAVVPAAASAWLAKIGRP